MDLKDLEEKLNEKLNGKEMDSSMLEDVISLMEGINCNGEKVVLTFDKDDNGKLKASVKVKTDYDIDNMSKNELEALLDELQDELDDLEDEEPDDSDEDAYEEWEDEVEELEEQIDEVKEKLEDMSEIKANIAFTYATCITEKYIEFTKVAKPVLLYGENENCLLEYLSQNENVKNSILDICNLILAANSVSISMIQRKLKIGYNKAGVIVEMLEELDAVTPFTGVCARKVKIDQLIKIKSFVEQ